MKKTNIVIYMWLILVFPLFGCGKNKKYDRFENLIDVVNVNETVYEDEYYSSQAVASNEDQPDFNLNMYDAYRSFVYASDEKGNEYLKDHSGNIYHEINSDGHEVFYNFEGKAGNAVYKKFTNGSERWYDNYGKLILLKTPDGERIIPDVLTDEEFLSHMNRDPDAFSSFSYDEWSPHNKTAFYKNGTLSITFDYDRTTETFKPCETYKSNNKGKTLCKMELFKDGKIKISDYEDDKFDWEGNYTVYHWDYDEREFRIDWSYYNKIFYKNGKIAAIVGDNAGAHDNPFSSYYNSDSQIQSWSYRSGAYVFNGNAEYVNGKLVWLTFRDYIDYTSPLDNYTYTLDIEYNKQGTIDMIIEDFYYGGYSVEIEKKHKYSEYSYKDFDFSKLPEEFFIDEFGNLDYKNCWFYKDYMD